jgi:hypothetical protein
MMKLSNKYIQWILVMLLLPVYTIQAQPYDAEPGLRTMSLGTSELRQNTTTDLELTFSNIGFTTIPRDFNDNGVLVTTIWIEIGLPRGMQLEPVLQSGEYVIDEENMFTWTYFPAENKFIGVPNIDIEGDDGTRIKIRLIGKIVTTVPLMIIANLQIESKFYMNDNSENNSITRQIEVLEPLPVTLIHFTANKEHTVSNLSWATSDEVNSDRFEVERSFDNKSWHLLGEVQANGNSNTPKNYHFTDDSPANGDNYYRLKMIDIDGKFEYSKHRSLVFDGLESVSVYPNPTTDLINMKFSDSRSIYKIVLQTVSGQVLYTEKRPGHQAIDIQQYPSGTYLLVVHRQDGRITSHKVVKQ